MSWSGCAYLLSLAILVIAAVRRRRSLALVGVGMLVATLIVRMFSGARGESLTLPTTGGGSR